MNRGLHVESALPAEVDDVARRVIGAAIEVHRHLGPGFLESTYHGALMLELADAGLRVQRQVGCAVDYKGTTINEFRLDVVVEDLVLIELKAVESILPIHRAQVRSYLKASGLQLALLLNFNAEVLRSGIHRIIMSQR